MMSGPELPYKISSSEEALACLRNTTKIIYDWRNDLWLDLNKPTSRNTVASSDLAPDLSAGLDFGGVIAQGFRGPSNHQRDQTMLQNAKLQMQPQSVPVSGFSILTKPTSRKTVTSYDLAPDPSASLNFGGVIAQGFCVPSNHQRYQTMFRNFKLQMQPQAVPVSDFSILTKLLLVILLHNMIWVLIRQPVSVLEG